MTSEWRHVPPISTENKYLHWFRRGSQDAGVVHLLGVVTWPAHVTLWPGHLHNFWAQGDFARSAKSMGWWCIFICIDSHNLMIHVFSRNPTDSYTELIRLSESYCIWNNTNCLIVGIHINKSAPFSHWLNPRPAGVWCHCHTSCWGGGAKGPPEISQTTGPISKFQTPFDSPVRELPVQGQKFNPEVTDDVTGQVKVRIFDFSGLVTSASKISMLSANKVNESAWIVSLTSVSIISCAL